MRHRWMQDPPDAVSPSRCRDARSEVERVDDDRGDDDARKGGESERARLHGENGRVLG